MQPMGSGYFAFAVTWILLTAKGNALKCYVCSTTLGLPGDLVTDPGCAPGETMDPVFLKECPQNQTYCTTHRITARLSTTVGVLTTVVYQLACSAQPLESCEHNIYNRSSVQYSEGCHKSCQTDGCNSLTLPPSFATAPDEATNRPEVPENSTAIPSEGLDMKVLLGSIAAVLALAVLILIVVLLLRRKTTKSSKPAMNSPPGDEPADMTSRKPQNSPPSDSVKYESINDDSEGYLIAKKDETKLPAESQHHENVPLQTSTEQTVA